MQMSKIRFYHKGKGKWKEIEKVKWEGRMRQEGTEITF